MKYKKKYRAVRIRRNPRRDPLSNVKQLVHDRLYLIADASKTMKTYRARMRLMVDDTAFWSGLEDLQKAMKKLKREYL